LGFVSNAEKREQIFVVDAYVLKGMSELLDGKLMVYTLLSSKVCYAGGVLLLADLHSLLKVACHRTYSNPFLFNF
jgi:hypothetical protein